MKKSYMNPVMEVVEVKTQQMLAASLSTGTYTGGDVDSRKNDELDW